MFTDPKRYKEQTGSCRDLEELGKLNPRFQAQTQPFFFFF